MQGISTPDAELEETQGELAAKGHPRAPLSWLSWRWFVSAVPEGCSELLDELRGLLLDLGLVHEEQKAWPERRARPAPFPFDATLSWSPSPSAARWRFDDTWGWPTVRPSEGAAPRTPYPDCTKRNRG